MCACTVMIVLFISIVVVSAIMGVFYSLDDGERPSGDEWDEENPYLSVHRPPCRRCKGEGIDDHFPKPNPISITCSRCGGSGREPNE